MKINKEVIDVGITKDVIEYLHSKTKLSYYHIEMVKFIRMTGHVENNLLITIQLHMSINNSFRQMSLDITKKKLTKLKRSLILDKIGI